MVTLQNNALEFAFPDVHEAATLKIDFQRTLRIPDDGNSYSLPPGLGRFPLQHVDDFARTVPDSWIAHGGVFLPMYQSEAVWLNFEPALDPERETEYPFAIKIATGKQCAISGDSWQTGLHRHPQDYVVAPPQPWLDGYCVEKGTIRQFVAMPLGADYSAEEQLTGEAEHGGIQIEVFPMKREAFERRFPEQPEHAVYSVSYSVEEPTSAMYCSPDMGLAPGGRMRQKIYDDPYLSAEWDTTHSSRCFIHIANSMVWRTITDKQPPTPPPTAEQYTRAGLPWFDWYDDAHTSITATDALAALKSVVELGQEKGQMPLPENVSVSPTNTVALKPKRQPDQVREWEG